MEHHIAKTRAILRARAKERNEIEEIEKVRIRKAKSLSYLETDVYDNYEEELKECISEHQISCTNVRYQNELECVKKQYALDHPI